MFAGFSVDNLAAGAPGSSHLASWDGVSIVSGSLHQTASLSAVNIRKYYSETLE